MYDDQNAPEVREEWRISEASKGKQSHRCVTMGHIISTGTHVRRFKIDMSRTTLSDGAIIPNNQT
jgi:hypothetical protein